MTFKVIRGQGQAEEMTSVPYRDYFFFRNPRWWMAAILNPLMRYLQNHLTHFYEIWYDNAYWQSQPNWLLNIWNFEIPRWQTAANLKIKKSWALQNCLTMSTKFCTLMHIDPPDCNVGSKIKIFKHPTWQTVAILKTIKGNNSAIVWPILMKCDKVMYIEPRSPTGY